jgi:type I restriction enzyme S subunit
MDGSDTITIEDATERLIDYRGKTPPKTDSGVRLITAKVVKGGRILEEPTEFIAAGFYNEWMRRGLPQKLDVLLTTEAPLGETAILRDNERIALAQRIILLRARPSKVDPFFLLYALQSDFGQGELKARATGTTVAGIKQSELRQVRIPIFPLPTQRRIGRILSAYDDLIENNTRRIRILEEMARAIYREWFVDFRFPGYQKVRMVDSAMGKIPQGWEAVTLGELCGEVRRGVQPDEVEPETPYFGLEHLPRKSIALSDWGKAKDVQSTKLAFKKGEILFGKIRPYFHKVGVAPVDGVCSSDAIVIVPKNPGVFGVVLSCVSSEAFVAHATRTSQGTKMPRANWGVLVRYPTALPPKPLLAQFNSLITHMVAQVQNMVFRIRNLRQTRDVLLLKLISGEVDVSELDIKTRGNGG